MGEKKKNFFGYNFFFLLSNAIFFKSRYLRAIYTRIAEKMRSVCRKVGMAEKSSICTKSTLKWICCRRVWKISGSVAVVSSLILLFDGRFFLQFNCRFFSAILWQIFSANRWQFHPPAIQCLFFLQFDGIFSCYYIADFSCNSMTDFSCNRKLQLVLLTLQNGADLIAKLPKKVQLFSQVQSCLKIEFFCNFFLRFPPQIKPPPGKIFSLFSFKSRTGHFQKYKSPSVTK